MPIGPMDSSGPASRAFIFEGHEYTIKPTILCGETIEILRGRMLQMRREECQELLRSPDTPRATHREIIRQQLEPVSVTWSDVVTGLGIPSILAEFLAIACDIKPSLAKDIAKRFEPFDELMILCIEAAGIGTLKNSSPLSQTGEQDAA